MGSEYIVKVTPYALEQMRKIRSYIATELQEPGTAVKWQNLMYSELASLSTMPNRIPLTPEEPWHSEGIHRMLVQNHFAYFWVDDDENPVWVTAVVYARRNQPEQLQQMPYEVP